MGKLSPSEFEKYAFMSTSSPPAPSARPLLGVIDLGTNNCRMLTATPAAVGFDVVTAFSRIVRLGEGLAETGQLSEAAMERTIDALHICANKFHTLGVQTTRAVTTEACRRASNAPAFIEQAKIETGIALRVISGDEEAKLTLAGCAPLLQDGPDQVLLFDIGGGSTEIVWAERGATSRGMEIRDILSLPEGVVTLTEQAGHEALSGGRADATLKPMRDAFIAFNAKWQIADALASGKARMLGTSGTVTTLAALKMGLNHYDRSSVDGTLVPRDGIEDTARAVQRMSIEARTKNACIGEKRADLVAAGIAVMDVILDLWPADAILVADRGIREGLLLEMVAETKK